MVQIVLVTDQPSGRWHSLGLGWLIHIIHRILVSSIQYLGAAVSYHSDSILYPALLPWTHEMLADDRMTAVGAGAIIHLFRPKSMAGLGDFDPEAFGAVRLSSSLQSQPRSQK